MLTRKPAIEPYCQVCWERGFASPARVVVGEGEHRRALCLQCHGDYERDKAEAERLRQELAKAGKPTTDKVFRPHYG
jgi:hypothetical protein